MRELSKAAMQTEIKHLLRYQAELQEKLDREHAQKVFLWFEVQRLEDLLGSLPDKGEKNDTEQ